jgi:hypothetical protein
VVADLWAVALEFLRLFRPFLTRRVPAAKTRLMKKAAAGDWWLEGVRDQARRGGRVRGVMGVSVASELHY